MSESDSQRDSDDQMVARGLALAKFALSQGLSSKEALILLQKLYQSQLAASDAPAETS